MHGAHLEPLKPSDPMEGQEVGVIVSTVNSLAIVRMNVLNQKRAGAASTAVWRGIDPVTAPNPKKRDQVVGVAQEHVSIAVKRVISPETALNPRSQVVGVGIGAVSTVDRRDTEKMTVRSPKKRGMVGVA